MADVLRRGWNAATCEDTVLWLVYGSRSVPVRRLWRTGLSVDLRSAAGLPGWVHLYEGDRHLATGLIFSEEIDGDEHRFRFKWMTRSGEGPPRDYAAESEPFAAYLPPPDAVRSGA